MKFAGAAPLVAALFAVGPRSAAAVAASGETSPISKVLQLISDFQAKVIKEGETAQKVYTEYAEWCEDRARQLSHEIQTGTAEVEGLKAAIGEEVATMASEGAKIDELASSIATTEADLKAATEVRSKEAADFGKEEAELVETVSMLKRATAILERETAKGGSAMLQMRSASSLADALKVLVDASAFGAADASRLTALIQGAQQAQDAEEGSDAGAPAAEVYESQSGNIIDTLQGLTEKAEDQLEELRKKETTALHNFEMVKQSLEDELRFANADLAAAKKAVAASAEKKAASEGDLEVATKELAADEGAKAELHHACMTKAQDFEAETASRGEELKALALAKKAIVEATGGAEALSYGLVQQPSMLQVARSRLASGTDLAGFEVVRIVRGLAQRQQSPDLAQLAHRVSSLLSLAARGSSRDPFSKVRGLISDMVERLEAEAGADASKKAYCDKELAETNEKKADKTEEFEKLSTQIEQMTSQSAQLKEQVAELQAGLAKLASAQAEMDVMRKEEHEVFLTNQADLSQGLEGVKLALKVLREYYGSENKAHDASGGASGIIGLLEVVESDFSKGLAEIVAAEETAAAEYEEETKENEIERTTKTKDVEHKTKEATNLDKTVAEVSADRSGVQAELDAVLEYLKRVEETCVAKAETYEDRKARRDAEIAGLKQALEVLEGETALLQRSRRRHRTGLRGGVLAA